MQYLSFEFEEEKEMREIMKKLWDQLGVTGEMSVRRLSSGHWKMDMIAEKELRESTLEKFASFRTENGD